MSAMFSPWVSSPLMCIPGNGSYSEYCVTIAWERSLNFAADSGVIDRVICFRIKERWLQNSSWEHDFVHRGVVIRIHCRRRHAPFRPVDRLADFLEVAIDLKI